MSERNRMNSVIEFIKKNGGKNFDITQRQDGTTHLVAGIIDGDGGFGVDDSMEVTEDSAVNVEEFKQFARKGFEENPIDILEVFGGMPIPEEVRNKVKGFNYALELLHCAVGMADEAGEVLDHIKKFVYHGKPLDRADIASEFGDLEWYKTNALRLLGIKYSETLEANIIKLDARYPDGRDKNYLAQVSAKDVLGENDKIRSALYANDGEMGFVDERPNAPES